MSVPIYNKEVKLSSDKEFYKYMMELATIELSKDENKKRMYSIRKLMRAYKNKGVVFKYTREYGADSFIKGGKRYYLYPNFLIEQRKGDNTLRVVYIIKSGGDTIKLAKSRSEYLGIGTECRVYLEGMNLRTALAK